MDKSKKNKSDDDPKVRILHVELIIAFGCGNYPQKSGLMIDIYSIFEAMNHGTLMLTYWCKCEWKDSFLSYFVSANYVEIRNASTLGVFRT